MEGISLYRKYRPQNFANLVGQDHIRTTLLNAIKTGHTAHAYLFCGPRGTGKTSTARLVAKALNCVNRKEDAEPCENCDICRDITEGRLIDLIEIDAASNRGIDEIRDLKEKIYFAPTRAQNKVYIIDEVHMMTKEAFNALLKTLEEPPSHVYFILATTEVYKIPATIISRCQRFDFRRIDLKTLMTRLSYIAQKEGIQTEDEAIEAIVRNVDGGLRDAIGLLDQLTRDGKLTYAYVREVLGLSDHQAVTDLFDALQQKEISKALSYVQNLYSEGYDLSQFTREFLNFIRGKMLMSVSSQKMEEVSLYLGWIGCFQKALESLRYSPIPQLPLEVAIIECCGDAKKELASGSQKQIPSREGDVTVRVSNGDRTQMQADKEVTEKNKEEFVEEGELKGLKKLPEEKLEFTFETVKQNWPRITERVTTPSLLRSLKDAVLKDIHDNVITLEFKTKFHQEKIDESKHRSQLEAVFFELFGKRVKIVSELKPIALEPVTTDSLADQALDIFGGEVVEE